eukprot:Gb_04174 [translate_table: standard]
MKSSTSEKNSKTRKSAFAQNATQNVPHEGPNWALILGGAIVSTLSVTFGRKLKQALEMNRQRGVADMPTETDGKSSTKLTSGICPSHSNLYCCRQDGRVCNRCLPGASDDTVDMKLGSYGAVYHFESKKDNTPGPLSSPQSKLSEIPRPQAESRETSPSWVSPEQLDLSNRPLLQSNSSESVCTSDTGSDPFTKRDVIYRLRQQLKRRDEMILEMQSQITDQQQTISSQLSHMANLQSQLDAANRDLFGAEREIQRLRKAIADHCAGHSIDMPCSPGTVISNYTSVNYSANRLITNTEGPVVGCVELCNGGAQLLEEQKSQPQRFEVKTPDVKPWRLEDLPCFSLDKNREITMHEHTLQRVKELERELAELKQLVSGKNYLLEAYENQRMELCSELKELQLKLGTQVPSVL